MGYGNPRIVPSIGWCCTDPDTGVLITDEHGQYIPADARTGAPKVAMVKCPTCKGRGKVVSPSSGERSPADAAP